MPDTITSVGVSAFENCVNLEKVTFSDNITTIGDYAFSECRLALLSLPDKLEKIGRYAFKHLRGVNTIDLPANLKEIGYNAFYESYHLSEINIPSAFNATIAEGAFYLCYGLEKVNIADIKSWLKISFADHKANPLYEAENLYLNRALVEELHIPENIILNSYAFAGANCIKSVYIPKTITTIPQNAFYECSGIAEVYYEGTQKEWDNLRIAAGNEALTNATLYTDYIPNAFKISYEADATDFVTNMPASAMAYGNYSVTSTVPMREGYNFVGWSTNANDTVSQYVYGDTLDIYSDTTLYAVWQIKESYTINEISILDTSFNSLNVIPKTSLIAEVSVTNNRAEERANIFVAAYNKSGKMLELKYMYSKFNIGQQAAFGAKFDNLDADIAKIKAFVISDLKSFTALCEAKEFTLVIGESNHIWGSTLQ